MSTSTPSRSPVTAAHGIEAFFLEGNHVSVIAAVAAAVVATWSAIISRRGVRIAREAAVAARDQAKAAADQAEAAWQQAHSAAAQSVEAATAGRMAALVAARDRVDRAGPMPAVLVMEVGDEPKFAQRFSDTPHLDAAAPRRTADLIVDLVNQWHHFIYFVVRGALFNDSDRAIRVVSGGPMLVEGVHPMTGEPVPVPTRAVPSGEIVMLLPGQFATFEWLAMRQVDDWRNARAERKEKRRDHDVATRFVFVPGGADEPRTTLDIFLHADPLPAAKEDDDAKQVLLPARCYVRAWWTFDPRYPTSAERIDAELTGDKHRLFQLDIQDSMRAGSGNQDVSAE